MKLLLQITLILIFTTQIYSQNAILNVHLNDGTVSSFTLTEIDSITFTVDGDGGGMGEPCPGIATVTYSGKTYNTVQIGDQCWLRENLDVGTMIASNTGNDNQTDNGIIEKYCYNNDPNNCDTYGGLYQWNEAMQYVTTPGTQGICPTGWHIPTYTELQALSSAVGGSSNALKAIGQGTGSGAGTNTSGFSALIAGFRDQDGGDFYGLGGATGFWSSTETGIYTYNMGLNYGNDNVIWGNGSFRDSGSSIRCLKD